MDVLLTFIRCQPAIEIICAELIRGKHYSQLLELMCICRYYNQTGHELLIAQDALETHHMAYTTPEEWCEDTHFMPSYVDEWVDNNGRLHRASGLPAVIYDDGFKMYFHHGRLYQPDEVGRRREWTRIYSKGGLVAWCYPKCVRIYLPPRWMKQQRIKIDK
jgi:hypothetical protein